MNKINVTALLCIVIIMIEGCTKEKGEFTTKIKSASGFVIDFVTKDTLSDIKLRLRIDKRGGSTQLKSFEQIVDSTFSNANGRYHFTFECAPDAPFGSDDYKNFAVEPVKNHYWKNPNMNLTTLECGSNLERTNVNIIPLSWIKVHIKNENPVLASDSIYYNGPSDQSSYYNRPSWKFGIAGSIVDTLFYVTIKATTGPMHFWDITENGVTTRSAAFISCDPLDTCELDIFY